MNHFKLGFLGLALAAAGSFANAETTTNCPIADADATVALVQQSKTCAQAAKVARDCAWGATADLWISGAAVEICARDYTNMTKEEMVGYEGLLQKCEDKYANKVGSLYRSFTARCRLDVAELYSKVYSTALNAAE